VVNKGTIVLSEKTVDRELNRRPSAYRSNGS